MTEVELLDLSPFEYIEEKERTRRERIEWKRKTWAWFTDLKNKQFTIWRMRDGVSFKYKLSRTRPSWGWEPASMVSDSIWEYARTSSFEYFRLLRNGISVTNIFKTKRTDEKIKV